MSDQNRAPRLREQYKDNAVAVEKNAADAAELRQKEVRIKAEEIDNNPKKQAEYTAETV